MQDGLFCNNNYFELWINNKELVKLYNSASEQHDRPTVRDLINRQMVFIEEVEKTTGNTLRPDPCVLHIGKNMESYL